MYISALVRSIQEVLSKRGLAMPALEGPYLGKVFARSVNRGNIGRMREGAGFASLTPSGSEELAGHVRGIYNRVRQKSA